MCVFTHQLSAERRQRVARAPRLTEAGPGARARPAIAAWMSLSPEAPTPPIAPLPAHDPVVEATVNLGPLDRWFLARLNDPRDLHGVHLMLAMTCTVIPAALLLFLPGVLSLWTVTAYYLLNFVVFLDRFVLMQHTIVHRPWFKRSVGWMNGYAPNVLGLFFGQTLQTYFAHHVVMHHTEDNGPGDLSSTLRYDRGRLGDLARYIGRFLLLGVPELAGYLRRKRRDRWLRAVVLGELASWLLIALAALVSWRATMGVFVFPILLTRLGMMLGNWGQHAFADASDPQNPYKLSATIISSRHNRRCFNNGYHVVHHMHPTMHWSEMPAAFRANGAAYDANEAMVFKGVLSFQLLTIMLALRRFDWVASKMVYADGGQLPREVALERLKRRIQPAP